MLREQYPDEPFAEQWWPARVISIEEYLEYYANTFVRYRPTFDAVAVVFFKPWWSSNAAEDGQSRMFELEAVEARSTSIKSMLKNATVSQSVPRQNCAADVVQDEAEKGDFLDLLTDPQATTTTTPVALERVLARRQLEITTEVGGREEEEEEHEEKKWNPPLAPSAPRCAEEDFRDGLRIAMSLADYADKNLKQFRSELASISASKRRKERLERAVSQSTGIKPRNPSRLDVSTAPLDVVHFPQAILNLDWKRVVDATRDGAPIFIEDLPEELKPKERVVTASPEPRREDAKDVVEATRLEIVEPTAKEDNSQPRPPDEEAPSSSTQIVTIEKECEEIVAEPKSASSLSSTGECLVRSSRTTDGVENDEFDGESALVNSAVFSSERSDEEDEKSLVAVVKEGQEIVEPSQPSPPPENDPKTSSGSDQPIVAIDRAKKNENDEESLLPRTKAVVVEDVVEILPAPKPRYRFRDAMPVALEESDTSRVAFERWSVHQSPSLEPPPEALLDARRHLIYGDDAQAVAASTAEAYWRCGGKPSHGAGNVTFPELWLYLTTRSEARRERKMLAVRNSSKADSFENESDVRPDLAPTRKSSRARLAPRRRADDEVFIPVVKKRKQPQSSFKPSGRPLRKRSAQDAVEALAERELAVLLSELEPVVLGCASESVQACLIREATIRDDDDDDDSSLDEPAIVETTAKRVARLRAARDERVAALRLLARADDAVQSLLARDERDEIRRIRVAAFELNEAETAANRVRQAKNPDSERIFAAEDSVQASKQAVEDVSLFDFISCDFFCETQARHARREIEKLRDFWRRTRSRIYARICGGVAELVNAGRKKPAHRSTLPKNKRPKTGSGKRKAASGTRHSANIPANEDSDDVDDKEVSSSEPYVWGRSRRARTLAIYDRRCRLHSTKPLCVEQSRRAVAAASVVECHAREVPNRLWVEGRVSNEYVQRATALLSYVHDRFYCSEVRRRCGDLATEATMLFGADDDDDTSANRGTWDASVAASAAVLAAVDAVVTGEAKNALCAVRPPGHHAGASLRALGAPTNGYCVLNHAALGATYAARERGLKRVAVFDFDVHHGNGTEDCLARTFDPSFLFVSIHAAGQDIFPGTGRLPESCLKDALQQAKDDSGEKRKRAGSIHHDVQRAAETDHAPSTSGGAAESAGTLPPRLRSRKLSDSTSSSLKVHSPHPGVLNIPVEPPPVTSDWLLQAALPRVIEELESFGPDLIVLSSGFDAHKRDPVNLGRLDAADYGEITRQILRVAERLCCGRVVSVLEGGYGVDCGPSGEYVPTVRKEAFDSCLRAHLCAMTACDEACSGEKPDAPRDEDGGQKKMHSTLPADTSFADALDQRGAVVSKFFRKPPKSASGFVDGGLTAGDLAQLGDTLDVDHKVANLMKVRD